LPERLDELLVACPPPVLGQQDQPQQGRVGGAVVRVVRLETEPGQLPAAYLVQDLAGFLVLEVVVLAALVRGEGEQRALGQRRSGTHGLVRGDQRVPPEEGEKPGQPGGRQHDLLAPGRGEDAQRGQVVRRRFDELL